MLAGSFASSYHGDPRTTNGIDLVIDPTREALEGFVRGLDADHYYVSESAALDAFSRRRQFNVSGILELRHAALDLDYIREWVHELGLVDEWDRVRRDRA